MISSLRIRATRATFLALPTANSPCLEGPYYRVVPSGYQLSQCKAPPSRATGRPIQSVPLWGVYLRGMRRDGCY